MQIIFMFPGQSSRYPTMFDKLLALDPQNREVLGQASELLGRDLQAHFDGSRGEEMFATNQDIQLGVFLANHMFLGMLQRAGIDASWSLGLSLGEWNHLVHIGALSFEQALLAVQARGAAYDAGPRGAMASFFPVYLEDLEPIIERARAFGVLEAVNLNSPRQQVLAGDWPALKEALRLADEELYVEGVVIERNVPMHASVFAPVGTAFRKTLEGLPFARPRIPYLPNRLAQLLENPTKEEYVELLSSHVHNPVLWRASIDMLVEKLGLEQLAFVEVGVKSVLYNLLDRKWHKGIRKYRVDSREDTAGHFETLVAELRSLPQPATTAPSLPLTTSHSEAGALH